MTDREQYGPSPASGAVLPVLVRSRGCSRAPPLGPHVGTGGRHGGADRVSDCTDCDSRRTQWHCARGGSDRPQLDVSSTGALRQRSYARRRSLVRIVEFSSPSGRLLRPRRRQ
jgi:hypothetical protein